MHARTHASPGKSREEEQGQETEGQIRQGEGQSHEEDVTRMGDLLFDMSCEIEKYVTVSWKVV